MNKDRVEWAIAAVQTFADITGLDTEADGVDTAITDLLADVMHLCDAEGLEFADLLRRAGDHYRAELAESD